MLEEEALPLRQPGLLRQLLSSPSGHQRVAKGNLRPRTCRGQGPSRSGPALSSTCRLPTCSWRTETRLGRCRGRKRSSLCPRLCVLQNPAGPFRRILFLCLCLSPGRPLQLLLGALGEHCRQHGRLRIDHNSARGLGNSVHTRGSPVGSSRLHFGSRNRVRQRPRMPNRLKEPSIHIPTLARASTMSHTLQKGSVLLSVHPLTACAASPRCRAGDALSHRRCGELPATSLGFWGWSGSRP